MIWVVLAVAAPFLWAVMNVVDKLLRRKYIKNSLSLTAIAGFLGFIPLLAVILFVGVTIPALPMLGVALLAGILSRIAILPYFEALSLEETSRVIPVFMVSPAFVLIMAFLFLGEKLNVSDYLAFSLIFAGSVLIVIRNIKGIFKINRAFYLILLSAFLFSVGDVLIKYVYTEQNFWNNLFWFYVGGLLGCFMLLANKQARSDIKSFLSKPDFSAYKLLALNVALVFPSTLLFFLAIMLGPISLVSVLGSGFQGLFILAVAIFLSKYFPKILKEEIDKKTIAVKAIAIFLMFGGLLLIYL